MRVFVDGTEIFPSLYNATYLNYKFSPADVKPSVFWADKALTPLYFGSEQKYDKLKVEVMFRNAGLADISALTEKLKRCEITINHRLVAGKTFDCVLNGTSLAKKSSRIYTVTYEFDCLVFGDWHEELAQNGTLTVSGSKETEDIITFTNKTTSTIASAKFNDITVRNLAKDEIFVVDGVKKLVTDYKRVDLFDFPKLKPGVNGIAVSGGSEVKVRYRERF